MQAQAQQVNRNEQDRNDNQENLAEQKLSAPEPPVVNQEKDNRDKKREQVNELPADLSA
jgi:hypothetical protein